MTIRRGEKDQTGLSREETGKWPEDSGWKWPLDRFRAKSSSPHLSFQTPHSPASHSSQAALGVAKAGVGRTPCQSKDFQQSPLFHLKASRQLIALKHDF